MMVDIVKGLFNTTEIDVVADFPQVPDKEVVYQVNAELTVPVGVPGVGQSFKAGNLIAWDTDRGDGVGEWVLVNGGAAPSGLASVAASVTQVVMTDAAYNYASTTEGTVPWGGDLLIDDGVVSHAGNNEYLVAESGRIGLSGGIALIENSGNTQRNNVAFWWEHQSAGSTAWAAVGMRHQSNYQRDWSGHNEVSQEFPLYIIDVAAGDKLRMRCQRIAGSGGTQRVDPASANYIQFFGLGSDAGPGSVEYVNIPTYLAIDRDGTEAQPFRALSAIATLDDGLYYFDIAGKKFRSQVKDGALLILRQNADQRPGSYTVNQYVSTDTWVSLQDTDAEGYLGAAINALFGSTTEHRILAHSVGTSDVFIDAVSTDSFYTAQLTANKAYHPGGGYSTTGAAHNATDTWTGLRAADHLVGARPYCNRGSDSLARVFYTSCGDANELDVYATALPNVHGIQSIDVAVYIRFPAQQSSLDVWTLHASGEYYTQDVDPANQESYENLVAAGYFTAPYQSAA